MPAQKKMGKAVLTYRNQGQYQHQTT